MGAAPSLTLLRPPRVRTGNSSDASPASHRLPATPNASTKRFPTLASLLRATPATALLAAQRQRLVTVATTDSLTGAFAKLIDADVLSAPVYDPARGRYVGWLDLRDLSGLLLVRYTYAREQKAARKKAAGAATGKSDDEAPSAPPSTPIACHEFLADTLAGSTLAANEAGATNATFAGTTAAADAKTAATPMTPTTAAAKGVNITIESLASRYPWRPLPSTATLFDVAKELVADVRRVALVDVATEQVVGVLTQSSLIQYLASRMVTPLPGHQPGVRVPLQGNAKANAVAGAPTPTLHAVTHPAPAKADAKVAATTAADGAAAQTGASAALGAAGALKLASAAANAGEAAAAAAAPASLESLGLSTAADSEWFQPLHSLQLASADSSVTAGPTIVLGSAPVWTVPDTTPLADALWAMHEANTSTLAITDTRSGGGLVATLTSHDLKLYLRNKLYGDALLERDVRHFLSVVRADEQRAAAGGAGAARPHLSAVAAIKAEAAAAKPAPGAATTTAHALDTAAPAVVVGPNASLAAVVQRMSVCHARKVFVCGTQPPFVPLRVITLTDVLSYVVASDAAAEAAAAAVALTAEADAVAATGARPNETGAGVALGSAIASVAPK